MLLVEAADRLDATYGGRREPDHPAVVDATYRVARVLCWAQGKLEAATDLSPSADLDRLTLADLAAEVLA